MNNISYFRQSCNTTKRQFDEADAKGLVVISQNKQENPSVLEEQNNRLLELIITYKTLKDTKQSQAIPVVVRQIIDIIETVDLINYSPFCVYMQVRKYPYYQYIETYKKGHKTEDEKIQFMTVLLDDYLVYRHGMYLYQGYTNMVLQVMADSASSRRNGRTGINLLEKILQERDFNHCKNRDDFMQGEKVYFLPDKGDKDLFLDFLKHLKVRFIFRQERDNKNPDMVLKMKGHFFIVEHKLASGTGGIQNNEINEIIHFIRGKERTKKIHYVSCLDGGFFAYLNQAIQEKNSTQKHNIERTLKDNPKNYFLNSIEFARLIDDFCRER